MQVNSLLAFFLDGDGLTEESAHFSAVTHAPYV